MACRLRLLSAKVCFFGEMLCFTGIQNNNKVTRCIIFPAFYEQHDPGNETVDLLFEYNGTQCFWLASECGPELLLVLVLAPRGFSPGTPFFSSPQNQHFQI